MKKTICVYCSSSNHLDKKFYDIASALGEKIATEGFNLVYGGSNVGCMGVVSTSAAKHGAYVTGIMPKVFENCGIINENISKNIITEDMNDRKIQMENLADFFVALPGSFGTMDEIFQVIVTKQLSYHKKGIVFLNVDGFYDPLFAMFENFYKFGFASEQNKELFHIATTVDEVIVYCKNYIEKDFALKR